MPILDTFQIAGTDYDLNATELDTTAKIDGVAYSAVAGVSRYAVCSTAAATAEKTVTITNTVAVSSGTTLRVKFANGNTAANPTLNVNSIAAYPIMVGGANPAAAGAWLAGEVIDLCFDGNYWQIIGGAMATGTTAGRVKIDATLSNVGEAADAKAAGDAIAGKQDAITGTAGQYVGFDSNGDPIATTPDAAPVNDSSNLVESGGVFNALVNLYPTDTISNVAIASFPDGADGIPVKDLTIDIDPVQDLHGYDNPWPAGGGKNLLDPDKMTTYGSGKGRHWYYDDGITLAANQSYTFSASTDADGAKLYIVDKSSGTTLTNGYTAISYTPTVDTIVYLQAYNNNSAISDMAKFQLEKGATATSYAPYSNICPISGWDEAKIWVQPTHDTSANPTVTIDLDGTRYGGTLDVTTGLLTVTHASVTLTDDNGSWNSSNKYLQIIRSRLPYPSVVPPVFDGSAVICDRFRQAESISDQDFSCGLSSNGNVRFYGEPGVDYGSAAGFIAAVGYPTTIYPLDPVLTYQLTPTEVTMLLGQNNVWADTGNVNNLIYHADVPLYIAKKLAEA